jgi:hypothetical protein
VRLTTLVVLLAAIAGARSAAAQTVIVRSAPPGSTIEVSLDGGRAVTATADASGDATLTIASTAPERSVHFHVDSCSTGVRVLIVSRGLQPAAAEAGCTRADVGSVFVMRPITTFVIDVNGADTVLHVSQGPPPVEWTWRGSGPPRGPGVSWVEPGRGISLSAGAGFSSFSNAADQFCGTATTCQKHDLGVAATLGADVWVTHAFAAHVSYLRPADVTATGSGDGYKFDSRLTARLFTVGGKAGVTAGPARIYALGGLNRHQSTSTTTQTVGGVTQSFGQQSQGWSWMLGGGVEGWMEKWVGVYADVIVPKIKGKPTGGGEGGIDDRAFFMLFGVRFRFGP